jgi:hypothetical protein
MIKILLQELAWLARFFAWLFAVGTLALLGVICMLLVCVQRTDRHATMMTDSVTDAWGLTYVGRQGAILALVEFVLGVGALWASRTRALAYLPSVI